MPASGTPGRRSSRRCLRTSSRTGTGCRPPPRRRTSDAQRCKGRWPGRQRTRWKRMTGRQSWSRAAQAPGRLPRRGLEGRESCGTGTGSRRRRRTCCSWRCGPRTACTRQAEATRTATGKAEKTPRPGAGRQRRSERWKGPGKGSVPRGKRPPREPRHRLSLRLQACSPRAAWPRTQQSPPHQSRTQTRLGPPPRSHGPRSQQMGQEAVGAIRQPWRSDATPATPLRPTSPTAAPVPSRLWTRPSTRRISPP
mmetsp:Transcript_25928/g.97683  ORF Transcript_25928/g.97683 Transcript_25928/m.97683 type:complete len:252 (+) Transcript_25928:671-1426(+)